MQKLFTTQGFLIRKHLTSRLQVHCSSIRSFRGSIFAHFTFQSRNVVNTYQCFDKINEPGVDNVYNQNVLSWNAQIVDYTNHGHANKAVQFFWHMVHKGVKPNMVTFLSLLNACAILMSLEQAKQVHAHIVLCEIGPNIFVDTAIIKMYMTCGSLEDARKVFDKMPDHDVVSWNAIITVYAKDEHAEEAFHLYKRMASGKVKPNDVTFISTLSACARLQNLEWGMQIHADVEKSEIDLNTIIANTLIDMYNKCGCVEDAGRVFSKTTRDVVSWNTMIAGYGKHGPVEEAFKGFQQMKYEGVHWNEITFVSILHVCTRLQKLEQGKQIHALVGESSSNTFVQNTLVDMYSKCGSLKDAQHLFERLAKRDVVSWNVIIAGHAKNGHPKEVFKLYERMEQEGVEPNEVTFLSICHACGHLPEFENATKLHTQVLKTGTNLSTSMCNAIVDMYFKCGSLEDAEQVFEKLHQRDVISWTITIAGYSLHGKHERAFRLLSQMECEGGSPNKVTFLTLLKASASLGNMDKGKQIHCSVINLGMESDISMMNTLVDTYAKCGSLRDAHEMFSELPDCDVVSWNAIITGYANYGPPEEAFKLFSQMEVEGVMADEVTLVSIINACACKAVLSHGKQIHAVVTNGRFESNDAVGSALIDMYAKCGNLLNAHQMLNQMSHPDVASWTAMIAGYAQHGHGKEALELADQMQREGVKLNHITFVSILSACSHGGLVNEGCSFFDSMQRDHGIEPTLQHYACMVDLLGRAGQLEVADSLIKKMPGQPTAALWMALLAACRSYGNVDLAKCAAENLLKLEPQNAATFKLLSNVYGSATKWDVKRELIKTISNS